MAKFKRGTRFVDWKIQGALVGHTLFHWASFWIASVAVVYGLQILNGVVSGDPESSVASVSSAMWDRYQPLAFAVIALLPLFCLDLILWSHRFAGPMIRIRRALHDLASGKSVQPIRLRAGDYWTDIAEDINLLQQRIERAEKLTNACQTVVLENRIETDQVNQSKPSSIAVVSA